MFVLLFGLMGVAAIFPVGSHYAGRGEQFDRTTALSDSAFGELRSRGLLQPSAWWYPVVLNHGMTAEVISRATGRFNLPLPQDNSTPGPGYAFVIDPMSSAEVAGANGADVFPAYDLTNVSTPSANGNNTAMPNVWLASTTNPGLIGNRWPLRRLTVPSANPDYGDNQNEPPLIPMPRPVAETIFRLRDDLAVEFPQKDDQPSIQRWRAVDRNGQLDEDPTDDTPLARDYAGNYSWLATVVPSNPEGLSALQPASPRFGSESYDVSVAVCYKRYFTPSVETERTISAALLPGGELAMYSASNDAEAVDAATKDLRATQWVAVAGVHPATGQFLLRWYRILSIDAETAANQPLDPSVSNSGNLAIRRAALEGPDWPAPAGVVNDLRAIIVPGVIDVTTQSIVIKPEQSQWQL
jgi:hypothetical protein